MISILSAAFGLTIVGLLLRRNLAAFVAGFFILFSLTYRIVDIAYVDVFGPIYAIELGRYVGGNIATPVFVYATLTFLAPLWYMYRRAYMRRILPPPMPDLPYFSALGRVALWCCAAFLAVLFMDMLRIGTIPVLVGMDRLQYNLIAGYLHNPLYELSFLLSSTLGIFTVIPRLQGKRYNLRFVILFLILLFYWVLTGNRFSIFYRDVSFFVLPFAAVVAMEANGKLAKITQHDAWSALFSSRVVVPMASLLAAGTLVGLLVNSYYDVRDYSDPLFQMTQRALVQPVQFWDVTWSNTDFTRDFAPSADAIDMVFFNPLIEDGNTTVQYLMSRELGYFRTMELLGYGQQYAGGYPEIFFELFGPWLSLFILLAYGTVTAWLIRLGNLALAQGKLLTCILSIYVFYGFTLTYIGGMLNFILAISFGVKIAALLLAMSLEGAFVQTLLRPHTVSKRQEIGRGLRARPFA